MKWNEITRFNFTWAIPGGAWLEDSTGYVRWCSFKEIDKHLGRDWSERQLKAQGWMTGCWIDVVPLRDMVTLNMDGTVYDGKALI